MYASSQSLGIDYVFINLRLEREYYKDLSQSKEPFTDGIVQNGVGRCRAGNTTRLDYRYEGGRNLDGHRGEGEETLYFHGRDLPLDVNEKGQSLVMKKQSKNRRIITRT